MTTTHKKTTLFNKVFERRATAFEKIFLLFMAFSIVFCAISFTIIVTQALSFDRKKDSFDSCISSTEESSKIAIIQECQASSGYEVKNEVWHNGEKIWPESGQ